MRSSSVVKGLVSTLLAHWRRRDDTRSDDDQRGAGEARDLGVPNRLCRAVRGRWLREVASPTWRKTRRELTAASVALGLGSIVALMFYPHVTGRPLPWPHGHRDNLSEASHAVRLTETIPQPTSALEPVTVLELLLTCLANNDTPFPDAGRAAVGNFLSLQSRQSGVLHTFIRGPGDPTYEPLVDSTDYEVGAALLDGESTRLHCTVVLSKRSNVLEYQWMLRRQQAGAQRNCWLVDDIMPADEFVARPGGRSLDAFREARPGVH